MKKLNNSNIVDINFNNNGYLTYDNKNYPADHVSWTIRSEDPNISESINLINIIDLNKYPYQISILKDLKFFFKNEINFCSYNSMYAYYKTIRYFFTFVHKNKIDLYNLSDINYQVLFMYKEHLKSQNNAFDKYTRLISILKKIKNHEIKISDDLINGNIPKHTFKVLKNTAQNLYTKDEFTKLFKVITNIINDYFNKKNDIPKHLFVKSSYWFIAFCSGLNETALKYMTVDSFDVKNDKDLTTYRFIGLKNRTSKGHQIATVSFNRDLEIHIFEKVMNELLKINNSYRHFISENDNPLSLFVHEPYARSSKTYQIYRGGIGSMKENPLYRKYLDEYKISHLSLSTQKIRNQWSNEMFDLSKSEQLVSSMLGHENLNTTLNHYMKNNISSEVQFKFNLLQQLMSCFSSNSNFNDWVIFQENFNISDSNIAEVVNKISSGYYSTGVANCFKQETNLCSDYIKCFNCKNFSIIGEKDLWKIMSFRESLIELDKGYEWLISDITNIIKEFDQSLIIKAKNLLKNSRHPFWRNNLMAEQIIIKHETTYA